MCGSLGIQHCALEQTEYQPKFIALISFDIFPIRICPTWINMDQCATLHGSMVFYFDLF